MLLRYLLLVLSGFSFGALASAGVFTVLVAISLVPRFAGRTHTASHILFYENCVVYGTIFGMIFSVFQRPGQYSVIFLQWISPIPEMIMGFFIGCFVGCLALSIAEMLDSIPIFARRVRLRYGMGIVILCVAFGKMIGAFYYFMHGF